jgi:hypothetical protein
MNRYATGLLLLSAALIAGCSKQESPPATQTAPPTVPAVPQAGEQGDDADVTRAKLNAGGVPAAYAAHFDAEKLVRIDEERRPPNGAPLNGEYTYQGARLLSYRGAKMDAPGTLELQFDAQGTLQSGRRPDLTEEDIAAIRNRAQLLRSHALAQRASRGHANY